MKTSNTKAVLWSELYRKNPKKAEQTRPTVKFCINGGVDATICGSADLDPWISIEDAFDTIALSGNDAIHLAHWILDHFEKEAE